MVRNGRIGRLVVELVSVSVVGDGGSSSSLTAAASSLTAAMLDSWCMGSVVVVDRSVS